MKKISTLLSTAAMLAVFALSATVNGQCVDRNGACGIGDGQCSTCNDNCTFSPADGMSIANCPPGCRNYAGPFHRAGMAFRDHFSPHPFYAYSKSGIDAQRIHQWNQSQAAMRPWHGGYNYWRYNAPTALVVPPTAAYQTEYAWGVGQTRSMPIYHQFGRNNPGVGSGDAKFANTPYWPANTNQFGVYPVRGPWE